MTPDPNRYGLLVIQAAVRSAAREVRVTHRRWVTTFELIGSRLTPSVLEKLHEYLGAPGPEGLLAQAVELAQRTSPREIRVSCQGRQLRLRGKSRAVLNKGPVDLMLELDRRPAMVKQVLTSYPHRLEDGPLHDCCQLTPMPVSIGGTPLRTRFSLKGCLLAMLLESAPEELSRLPVYLPGKALLERRTSPGPYSAAVGIVADDTQSKTTLVVDGVAVEGPRVHGLRAVVWSSAFRLNPALTGVVEGGGLDRLQDELEAARRTMQELLWERLPAMSAVQRERATPYLRSLAPGARLAQMQRLLDDPTAGPSAVLLGIAAERARAEGDLLEAQSYYLRALEHPDAIRPDLLPDLIQVMFQLRARPRQLEPFVREMIGGLNQKVGSGHKQALAAYFEQMGQYSATHGYEREARGYYLEALSIQEGLLGKHHPTVEKLRETLDSL